MRKICSVCKEPKDVKGNFFKARKEGQYRSACKDCRNNKRKTSGEYKIFNASDKAKEAKKKYRATSKGKRTQKNWALSKNFGITLETYELMLKQQEGKCKICSRKFSSSRTPQVDHCHSTSKVRGLLCKKCNLGLGHFEDNSQIMRNAIEYLEETI